MSSTLYRSKLKKKKAAEDVDNSKFRRSLSTTDEINWKEYHLNLPLEEKRKSYHCGSKFMVLDDVQHWPDYAKTIKEKVRKKIRPLNESDDKLNMKISLWQGDITRLEIDAIVNAANSSLLGGGGVDGAIHRAAGKHLVEECYTLNGCATGHAKLTGGYKLPAKYIIHTVGPIGQQPKNLASCYRACLNIAKANDIRTIAFPCISTGIYGYDVEKATPVVMETVRGWLTDEDNADAIDRIIFCVFLKNDVAVYESNLLQYFPVDKFETPEKKRHKTSVQENFEPSSEKEDKNQDAAKETKEDGDGDEKEVEKLKERSDIEQKETDRKKSQTDTTSTKL